MNHIILYIAHKIRTDFLQTEVMPKDAWDIPHTRLSDTGALLI